MEKAASAIENLKEEKHKIKEAKAEAEKRSQVQEKLIKMASEGKVDVEDVPGLVEKYANMEDEEFRIEMRALEKTANIAGSFDGELADKQTGDTGNPLVDLVLGESPTRN